MNMYVMILLVGAGCAIANQVGYQLIVRDFKKSMKPKNVIKVVRVEKKQTFRPELDFDLGVKKVDKIRFGDEA